MIQLSSATARTAVQPAGTSPAPTDGTVFKAQLDGTVRALFAGKTTVEPSASSTTGAPALDTALVQKIRDALDRGTPLSDIVNQLAGSLATSVAAQLGISTDAAKQRLTQAFTDALSSPQGAGPPGTNAERASSLVSRLRQLAEIATRVVNGDPGQPIRTIAGTSLDADSAKANPAPQPDSILRDALAALAAPASPTTGATAAASATDGRTVAFDPAQAIASDGDTPLGRILARALAGSQRSAPAAVSTDVPDGRRSILPEAVNPNVTLAGLRQTQGRNGALDAFVQAFTSALARDDAKSSSRLTGSDSQSLLAASPLPTPALTDAVSAPPMPFSLPSVNDVTAAAPPAPAATLPQSQANADANAIVDQLLRGVSLRTSDGSSEVRLRLVPENLGDVSVKLVVTGGSVDASITAHTADAQNALAGGQAQLARTLADAGLKLQSFTVGLAGGGFADNRDQTNQQSWGRPSTRRFGGVEAIVADDPADPSLIAAPVFGPPIFSANPLMRGLNYLV
jgi:flagellar hook-length control protein FliK